MIDLLRPNRQATTMKRNVRPRQRPCRQHQQRPEQQPTASTTTTTGTTTTRKMMMLMIEVPLILLFLFNYDVTFPIQFPSSLSIVYVVLFYSSQCNNRSTPPSSVRRIVALSATMTTTIAARSSPYHDDENYDSNDGVNEINAHNMNDNDDSDDNHITYSKSNKNDKYVEIVRTTRYESNSNDDDSDDNNKEIGNSNNNEYEFINIEINSKRLQRQNVQTRGTENTNAQCDDPSTNNDNNNYCDNNNYIVQDESIEWLEETIERFLVEMKTQKSSNDDDNSNNNLIQAVLTGNHNENEKIVIRIAKDHYETNHNSNDNEIYYTDDNLRATLMQQIKEMLVLNNDDTNGNDNDHLIDLNYYRQIRRDSNPNNNSNQQQQEQLPKAITSNDYNEDSIDDYNAQEFDDEDDHDEEIVIDDQQQQDEEKPHQRITNSNRRPFKFYHDSQNKNSNNNRTNSNNGVIHKNDNDDILIPDDDDMAEKKHRYIEYQRSLLTKFFYAITGTKKSPTARATISSPTEKYGDNNNNIPKSSVNQSSGLRTYGLWLNDDINYCNWDGVMCAYEDKFIDQQKKLQRFLRQQKRKKLLAKQKEERQQRHEDDDEEDDDDDEDEEEIIQIDYEIHHNDVESPYPFIPDEAITRIEIGNGIYASELVGTIPGKIVSQMEYMLSFVLSHNNIRGTIPGMELGKLQYVQRLDLSYNFLTGTIPYQLFYYEYLPKHKQRHHLRECLVAGNILSGPLPNPPTDTIPSPDIFPSNENYDYGRESVLFYFDLSHNSITGTIPPRGLLQRLSSLEYLFLTDNRISGTLPGNPYAWSSLRDLQILDLSMNQITNANFKRIIIHDTNSDHAENKKRVIKFLPSLRDLNLASNNIIGQFPTGLLQLTHLHALLLDHNHITGTIPDNTTTMISYRKTIIDDDDDDVDDVSNANAQYEEVLTTTNKLWKYVSRLSLLTLGHNDMEGSIPMGLITTLKSNLRILDLSYNRFTGTIPTELGLMTSLITIDAMCNHLRGTIPTEMVNMNPNLRLNFTNNLITGTIPGMFCGYGASSMNMLYREFGCDAVLCRPGTFSIHGHATLHSACRPCPSLSSNNNSDNDSDVEEYTYPDYSMVLGRTWCETADFVHGDLNGDGVLSSREILRMLYVDTIGRFWGPSYHTWADMSVHECKLMGVTCSNGEVSRVNLSNAELCSDGEKRAGPRRYCTGIPAEIGDLNALEVLQLNRQAFLRGKLPTELGKLSLLRVLDVSGCSLLSGTIPTEIGGMTNLRRLMLSHCHFTGSIPKTISKLSHLEKLHFTSNMLIGSLPLEIGRLQNVKEFMVARNRLTGTLPTQIGRMTKLENFEAYLNDFEGSIPSELGLPTIKRIDAFANRLTGTIPSTIARVNGLQILHLKDNRLTGVIPFEFGNLPYLSWFDISKNYIHGTIPSSFGSSVSLDDFRIVDNYIHGTIPPGLCHNNPNINGGAVQIHKCYGIACPQGWYSPRGYATIDVPCEKCPDGTTNLYMSSSFCDVLSDDDILSILFEVMGGRDWPIDAQINWSDFNVPLCEWGGIDCDENGEMTSISFPIRGQSGD